MSYLNSGLREAPIRQTKTYPKNHTKRISDPVAQVGITIEGGLNELNDSTVGTCQNKNRSQFESTRVGEWEDKGPKGQEMHQLIASLQNWE